MKRYLVFLDVLGFEHLPEHLSGITGLEVSYIRENFLVNPLQLRIEQICSSEDRHYQFTDDHFIVVNSIDKVFRLIKAVSSIIIPLISPIQVPVEIAVGKGEISNTYNPINDNETIEFLKYDILKNYREWHKSKNNGKSIKNTFVALTNEFYEDLPSNRHVLCKEINFEGKKYFEANLEMMSDVDGSVTNDIRNLLTFKEKISNIHIWKFFEIKSLIYKDKDDSWKSQFI